SAPAAVGKPAPLMTTRHTEQSRGAHTHVHVSEGRTEHRNRQQKGEEAASPPAPHATQTARALDTGDGGGGDEGCPQPPPHPRPSCWRSRAAAGNPRAPRLDGADRQAADVADAPSPSPLSRSAAVV